MREDFSPKVAFLFYLKGVKSKNRPLRATTLSTRATIPFKYFQDAGVVRVSPVKLGWS